MVWVLSILLTISIFVLTVSIYFNVKHGKYIIGITEALEESLEIMDKRYDSISQVLEVPLFYDSPQVRQVQSDIKVCRDSILYIANILTDDLNKEKVLIQEQEDRES